MSKYVIDALGEITIVLYSDDSTSYHMYLCAFILQLRLPSLI